MSARRERETSADGPFRNLGWARGDRNIHDVRTRAERARHAAGDGCGRRDSILTAWPLAAGQQRRRPWRAQALAAAGLRAVGRATQHSLRSHSERDDEHRRIILTTQHIDHGTSIRIKTLRERCFVTSVDFSLKNQYTFSQSLEIRTSRCPAQVRCVKFASFFSAPVLPTFFCPFFVLGVVIFF